MNPRLDNALGLCMKAGKCQSGEFAVETAVKQGKAKLVLLQTDASENSKKGYADLCAYYKVPLIMTDNVGKAIGKPSRMAMAVTDESFVKMIMNAKNSEEDRG
ncbi:MAG: ribosomal L7Ae/L30e/S12e/Gadd45 family protein [Clostridia bacterium]|nr:ribosomal L7Ae/L30e/S12e/Gadd45 family protein [Clostridia bacterium]